MRLPYFLIIPLALVACAAESGDGAASSDQALGEPETRGFVTPDLSADAEKAIYAKRYTHLDPTRAIADNLLFDAVAYFDANKARLENTDQIAIVDFAKHSGKKRFYVIDMASGAVKAHTVAHGSGSEDGRGYAKKFNDIDGAHTSSLGFVVTGDIYSGKHGRSLRLFGLSTSNAHMNARAIVIHGADYVGEDKPRQGNSWGCFALDMAVKDSVVKALANGALLYAGLGKTNSGDRPSAAPEPPPPPDPPVDETPKQPLAPTPGSTPDGAPCDSDATCNPGEDASGFICVAGKCAAGCRDSSQCPGNTTCQSGSCR